jgi:hypothetical protein
MRATSIFIILSAGALSAADRMNISVCNFGEASQKAVTNAETEVSAFFRAAKVDIVWKNCDDLPGTKPANVRWFVLRVRDIKPLSLPVTSASLDVLGRAFVAQDGEGDVADAYFEAVEGLAGQYRADAGTLLGYVIVHELGHLLLGPGHGANGVNIMRAKWSPDELRALKQRWLRFTKPQEAAIHLALKTNRAASGQQPN